MPPSNSNFSSDSNDAICVEHQYGSETAPSIAIVQAIAVIEDVDPIESPTELGMRLYDHVDPAALDQLVTGTDGSDSLTIDLTIHDEHRYSIRVQDTGQLIVEKLL